LLQERANDMGTDEASTTSDQYGFEVSHVVH